MINIVMINAERINIVGINVLKIISDNK